MTYYFLKHYKLFTKLILIAVTTVLFSVWGIARAQTQSQLAHILTTVVQLEDVTSDRGVEQMSTGVIIHSDGYILTPDLAPSINTDNTDRRLFRVYMSSAENTPSKWRYMAVLDRQLPNNLQLLRIISRQDGSVLAANETFLAMEIAGASLASQSLGANSPVVLWSFPAGIAKFVERAAGQVVASQGTQVFSNVQLALGNIGGVVTTSFDSNALPQLSAIATGVDTNQLTRLVTFGQELQSYLPNYAAKQLASRSFAAPQAGVGQNYQLQSTFALEDEFETRVPISYATFGQDGSSRTFDPLGFLKENPNNNASANSAPQPSSAATFASPSAILTNQTSQTNQANQANQTNQVMAFTGESGQNIIIQATPNANSSQSGLVASPVNPAYQDVYGTTVSGPNPNGFQVGQVGQVGQAGGQLPVNATHDALLSVFAGQPQTGHVSSQEVANFMQQAARGGTVNLQAGVYYLHEGIELTQDVSLRGAGKNQTFVVVKSGYHVIKFSGQGNFSAEGISFVYDGLSDANGLHILAGHVSLSDVRSTNTQTKVDGLSSLSNQQQVREGSGVLLDLYVQSARIEKSEFDFNPAFGIAIRGQVKPLINQNLIHHNGLAGIRFTEQSGGQVEHNIIEENTYFGIDVSAVGRVQLERNSFRRNGGFGVNAIESAQVNFAHNNFDANGQGEIRY